MKKLLPLFAFCVLYFTSSLEAQWSSLGSGIAPTNRVIGSISVVNEDVVWGITWSTPGFFPTFEFARTTDGGETWSAGLIDAPSNWYVLQIHAISDQIAWVAVTDEADPISGKVFRTSDGGESWTEQSSGFTGINETPAGVYFWDENAGVAFGATGLSNFNDQIAIYTTDDGGDTWTSVSGGDMPQQLPGEGMWLYCGNGFFSVSGDHVWFITNGQRIFRSENRGKSWTAHDTGIGLNTGLSSIAFKDSLNGIATTYNPVQGARTSDGGITWTPIAIPSNPTPLQIEYVPGTEGTYIIHNSFAGGTNPPANYAFSHDNGDTWEVISMPVNLDCMQFISPFVGFAGGKINSPTEGGFYKWTGEPFPSSVREVAASPLSVIPNPSQGLVEVQLPGRAQGQNVLVEVQDLWGRALMRQTLRDGAATLDMGHVPAGLYVIRVWPEGGGKGWVGKVVKG